MAVNRTFYQIGWVVDDLDKQMQKWLESGTTGPFLVMPHACAGLETQLYRGHPADIDMSIGLTQLGSIQLELIAQHDDSPSAYRDTVAAGRTAVHHMAWITDDLDAEYAEYHSLGIPPVFEGTKGDYNFAYFDTSEQLGCMTELMQRSPDAESLNDVVAAAALDWDGSDPIRVVQF
ncbi:VOC family protein [Rhodococcus sp. IEGM1428]|uniref:VOC family protein n=1 Tax=Rhodococcus sp. IEGM1428 TaxID=3392191 RepID=UPI003D0C2CAE